METLSPFQEVYAEESDLELVQKALDGSSSALEALVKKHQHYIYNVAHKMVLSPFDAEDITQEVLIKMVTKLSQFQGRSSFRTWLYRITFNHFLKMKKYWLEEGISSFDQYGRDLDQVQDHYLNSQERLEMQELIEEAKLGCMAGMLLCLDRQQRLVYILGEVFKVDHHTGAELLELTPDNFRQRLSRARKDLYQFMHRKCGLVNEANPCRCHKKTRGFIAAGWVDPEKMKFNTDYLHKILAVAGEKSDELCDTMEEKYGGLFRDHPFQEKDHATRLMKEILQDRGILNIFDIKPDQDNA